MNIEELSKQAFSGGYDEHECIKDSLTAQLRRHVDWFEDGVVSKLSKDHGMKLANGHYHYIRIQSMKNIVKLSRSIIDRLEKAVKEDVTEF